MPQQTFINGETYLSHREKLNSNFTEVYSSQAGSAQDILDLSTAVSKTLPEIGNYQFRVS